MQTRYFDLRDTKGQQKEIEDKIAAAAKILRDGGLVGIPTETVYGLGANALDGAAVKRIFEAKGRPQDNPLIIHVTGPQWLPRYCADVPPLAYVLARKFWPGPLTMILKRRPIIPDETTAGLDTVAVRCPNHPVTLAIIREAGIPIAAPSANLSGRPSCTTAQDVLEERRSAPSFPQGRVTGPWIGLTLYRIDAVLDGDLDELIDALVTADQAEAEKAAVRGAVDRRPGTGPDAEKTPPEDLRRDRGEEICRTRYFDLRDTKGQQKEIEDKIAAAAKESLQDGGLVGIPTGTVYGLGANAWTGPR